MRKQIIEWYTLEEKQPVYDELGVIVKLKPTDVGVASIDAIYAGRRFGDGWWIVDADDILDEEPGSEVPHKVPESSISEWAYIYPTPPEEDK